MITFFQKNGHQTSVFLTKKEKLQITTILSALFSQNPWSSKCHLWKSFDDKRWHPIWKRCHLSKSGNIGIFWFFLPKVTLFWVFGTPCVSYEIWRKRRHFHDWYYSGDLKQKNLKKRSDIIVANDVQQIWRIFSD